jgi:hypothetical protein
LQDILQPLEGVDLVIAGVHEASPAVAEHRDTGAIHSKDPAGRLGEGSEHVLDFEATCRSTRKTGENLDERS